MSVTRSATQYAVGIAVGVAFTATLWSWGARHEVVAVPSAQEVRQAEDLSVVFRKIAAETTPSIVSIETSTKARPAEGNGLPDEEFSPFREFFRNDPQFQEFFRNPRRRMMTPRQQGAGSGFIIDSAGIIMTNNHVVNGADVVRVRLSDGREFVARDIKTDPRSDVAIIRIDGAGPLKALRLGDSRKTEVGDWVLAFGTPFGLEMTVTQGIISGKGRSRFGQIAEREDFLQTDAAINPGNSGGPLVNLYGEVIGINTAIASASGGYDGIGFAVPTHIAGWVGEQLVKNGAVRRGYLGTSIAAVDNDTAKQFNVGVREGAIVRGVTPKSPAEKAGIEPGDVIVSLNGEKVSDPTALQGIVERLTIDKSYPLVVIRSGAKKTLDVRIEEMPKDFTAARNARSRTEQPSSSFDEWGLQLRPLTKELARQLGVDLTGGVVVTNVKDDSLASQAGITTGDVIERVGNTPVATVEDFKKAVEALSLKDGIVLHLRGEGGKRYVILKSEE